MLTFDLVLGSVLASIYRALQDLDAKLIVRDAGGGYHICSVPQSVDQHSEAANGETDNTSSTDWQAQSSMPALPDFNVFDIPSDLFMMLPEIEPISVTVNAGYDITLDDNWF